MNSRGCVRCFCVAASMIHIAWAVALCIFSGLLLSNGMTSNLGFEPTLYDLIFYWVYDIVLLITGLSILYSLIQKKQRVLSWTLLIFTCLQTGAFTVAVVMLSFRRFAGFHYSDRPSVDLEDVIIIITVVHSIGTTIYSLMLVACIHKLDDRFSPYWK
ncbi:unnamed protein product [Orchesella dallaii]|uniref:Uncharacterized protein n=1 Tax=Orchesella dallaii TaxID=48710 RepID=A0ABP1R8K4_9HEXA